MTTLGKFRPHIRCLFNNLRPSTPSPAAQPAQSPPQSRSDSCPFRTPSSHAAAWHSDATHTTFRNRVHCHSPGQLHRARNQYRNQHRFPYRFERRHHTRPSGIRHRDKPAEAIIRALTPCPKTHRSQAPPQSVSTSSPFKMSSQLAVTQLPPPTAPDLGAIRCIISLTFTTRCTRRSTRNRLPFHFHCECHLHMRPVGIEHPDNFPQYNRHFERS